jgi:hypothetical protein
MKRKRVGQQVTEPIDTLLLSSKDVARSRLQRISRSLKKRAEGLKQVIEKCIPVKDLVPIILGFDDLTDKKWQEIHLLCLQPITKQRGNSATSLLTWSEWYLGRRVSLRDVQTIFETMFEPWAADDNDNRFVFAGPLSFQLIRDCIVLEWIMSGDLEAWTNTHCSIQLRLRTLVGDSERLINFTMFKLERRANGFVLSHLRKSHAISPSPSTFFVTVFKEMLSFRVDLRFQK